MVRLGVQEGPNIDMFAVGSGSPVLDNFGMSIQASELSIAHWVKVCTPRQWLTTSSKRLIPAD